MRACGQPLPRACGPISGPAPLITGSSICGRCPLMPPPVLSSSPRPAPSRPNRWKAALPTVCAWHGSSISTGSAAFGSSRHRAEGCSQANRSLLVMRPFLRRHRRSVHRLRRSDSSHRARSAHRCHGHSRGCSGEHLVDRAGQQRRQSDHVLHRDGKSRRRHMYHREHLVHRHRPGQRHGLHLHRDGDQRHRHGITVHGFHSSDADSATYT